MASKPLITKIAKDATAKDVQVAINNAISLALHGEDGPPEARMRRLAQYARGFYGVMQEHLDGGDLLRPAEGVVILLVCALLTQQALVAEEDRKVPAQEVLDLFFKDEA